MIQELEIADCFLTEEEAKRYWERLEKALQEFKIKYPKEQKLIDKAKKIEYGSNHINTPSNLNDWVIDTNDKNTKKVWIKFIEFIDKEMNKKEE